MEKRLKVELEEFYLKPLRERIEALEKKLKALTRKKRAKKSS